jgi:hypothetical protein
MNADVLSFAGFHRALFDALPPVARHLVRSRRRPDFRG